MAKATKVNFTIRPDFYGYFGAPDSGLAYVHYKTDNAVYMVDLPSSVLKRFFEDGDEDRLFEVIFEANRLWQDYHSARFETDEEEEFEYDSILEALENL